MSKKSLRKIKKDIKMKRDPNISSIPLSLLSFPLQVLLSENSGLVLDSFSAGDIVVDFSSGDIIMLNKDTKNGENPIAYKQIWEKISSGKYIQKYNDWMGGELYLLSPVIPCSPMFMSYYGKLRLATNSEKRYAGIYRR